MYITLVRKKIKGFNKQTKRSFFRIKKVTLKKDDLIFIINVELFSF